MSFSTILLNPKPLKVMTKKSTQQGEQEFTMKEGQLMVFKNGNKEKDTHPDLWCKCMIGGQEYRVSLWTSESKAGNKYWNGQISDYKPKTEGDDVDL